jgi:ABC-type transporter MlaC component
MQREGSTWRAVDFSVEGVSLVNHYRKSFARFLVNHSFEELLAKLRPRARRK